MGLAWTDALAWATMEWTVQEGRHFVELIPGPWGPLFLPDRQAEQAIACCLVCGGQIYAGERCVEVGEALCHLDCVREGIAGEE